MEKCCDNQICAAISHIGETLGKLGKSGYSTVYFGWKKFGVIGFFHGRHRVVKCWVWTIFPPIFHGFTTQGKWPLYPVFAAWQGALSC
jgi:hypothetical protein